LTYRYRTIGKQTGGGLYEYFENGIGKLPIKVVAHEIQKHFIVIVNLIREMKSKNADTNGLENQIDMMVCKLYDLDYSEVRTVVSRVSMSETEYNSIILT
jgi:hypothetical protein